MQAAGVVLEGGHLQAAAQSLRLQVAEVVVIVVLDDDTLQLADLTLHLAAQLPLKLL